jgi:hypothetical protein
MVDYEEEVLKDSVNFLVEHEEMIVKALAKGADFDYNEIDNLDSAWHENIIDRSYTSDDAAFVLDNCKEEENDSGLWEGKDAKEALQCQAAYSYGNDCWEKVNELYNEMILRADEIFDNGADGQTNEGAAQAAFDEFKNEQAAELLPVEKGSEEEKSLVGLWLRLADAAGGFWSGYPVGSAYIDSRCGVGFGMSDVLDFVQFDHDLAKQVPWLHGKRREEVRARRDELLESERKLKGDPTDARSTEEYVKGAIEGIWSDPNLSVADIRKLANDLMYRAD